MDGRGVTRDGAGHFVVHVKGDVEGTAGERHDGSSVNGIDGVGHGLEEELVLVIGILLGFRFLQGGNIVVGTEDDAVSHGVLAEGDVVESGVDGAAQVGAFIDAGRGCILGKEIVPSALALPTVGSLALRVWLP